MKQRAIANYAGENDGVIRASVSFPQKDYSALEKIASQKKVSVAWVVREAVTDYLYTMKKDEEIIR
jgi:hypothetical protein